MKKSFLNYVVGGALFLSAPMFTSCQDILGEWDKPTPVNNTPSTPSSDDSFDAKATPLTFEAVSGTTVLTIKNGGAAKTIQYKLDDGDWTTVTVSAGDWTDPYNPVYGTTPSPIPAAKIIQLRADNDSYSEASTDNYDSHYMYCSLSAKAYVYGNIMSLISSTDFANKELDDTNNKGAFSHLLCDLDNMFTPGYISPLVNHDTKDLVLPSTTIQDRCYFGLFYYCNSLTKTVELPATILKEGCYRELYANCTGITTSPVLHATSLVNNCYASMFENCSNLTKITCLATTGIDGATTNYWVSGTSATGTFVKATAADWSGIANPDTDGIPSGWSTTTE